MKFFLFLPALALITFSFIPCKSFTKNNLLNINDTNIINHVLDGSTAEWSANKFEQDKGTNIKYAIDNDTNNFYIAMIIPDVRIQMKMMRLGMELYIDVKGKKREDKGIRFPIKKERGNFSPNSNDNQNTQKQKPDIKEIRSMMVLNLLSLQLIGFSDDESKDQDLMLPGSVNIQYTWGDADIMYVEYNIPLILFNNNSLNQKTISLGWKLNGAETSPSAVAYTTTTVVGVPSGTRPPQNRSGSGNTFNQSNRQPSDDRMKEQSFWTKYTVTLPTK